MNLGEPQWTLENLKEPERIWATLSDPLSETLRDLANLCVPHEPSRILANLTESASGDCPATRPNDPTCSMECKSCGGSSSSGCGSWSENLWQVCLHCGWGQCRCFVNTTKTDKALSLSLLTGPSHGGVRQHTAICAAHGVCGVYTPRRAQRLPPSKPLFNKKAGSRSSNMLRGKTWRTQQKLQNKIKKDPKIKKPKSKSQKAKKQKKKNTEIKKKIQKSKNYSKVTQKINNFKGGADFRLPCWVVPEREQLHVHRPRRGSKNRKNSKKSTQKHSTVSFYIQTRPERVTEKQIHWKHHKQVQK